MHPSLAIQKDKNFYYVCTYLLYSTILRPLQLQLQPVLTASAGNCADSHLFPRLIVKFTHVQTKQDSVYIIHYLTIQLILALNIILKVMQTLGKRICACV